MYLCSSLKHHTRSHRRRTQTRRQKTEEQKPVGEAATEETVGKDVIDEDAKVREEHKRTMDTEEGSKPSKVTILEIGQDNLTENLFDHRFPGVHSKLLLFFPLCFM